jgi:hypothetical protein
MDESEKRFYDERKGSIYKLWEKVTPEFAVSGVEF